MTPDTIPTMPSGANGYVFAVCGDESHFRALRRALASLRPRTKQPIRVLLDRRRNPGAVLDAEVISVDTPEHLDHHQAAIFMKTSAHRHLPTSGIHCYLDSDVLAASPEVDQVFEQFEPPVTFASDLPFPDSNLQTFSSHAIDCGCRVAHQKLQLYFQRLRAFTRDHLKNVDFPGLSDPCFYDDAVFDGEIRGKQWWTGEGRAFHADGSLKYVQVYQAGRQESITYYFPGNEWRWVKAEAYEPHGLWATDDGLSFRWVQDPVLGSTGYWLDQDGDSFRPPGRKDQDTGAESPWWYRGEERLWRRQGPEESGHWLDAEGRRAPSCDHLSLALEERFDVRVRDRSWKHWNGGVFLFDSAAPNFLENWHRTALDLFDDSGWRVRDQGALVAAAFGLDLENQPRLPRAFNLIADRQGDPGLWPELVQIIDAGEARLAHLINGGAEDREWPIWQALERAWSSQGRGEDLEAW